MSKFGVKGLLTKVPKAKETNVTKKINRTYKLTTDQINMLEKMWWKIHETELHLPKGEQTGRDEIVGRAIEELYEREGKE